MFACLFVCVTIVTYSSLCFGVIDIDIVYIRISDFGYSLKLNNESLFDNLYIVVFCDFSPQNVYRSSWIFLIAVEPGIVMIVVVRLCFVNYKKGALDSQPQMIKFISCLPMVGGSLRFLRLLPPLKLVAMI